MKLFVHLFAAFAMLLSQHAFADEPLSVSLEAAKVVRGENGKEQMITAQHAKPGDVLEYRATYKNASGKSLRGVMALLPVPTTGVAYLLDTARPSTVAASVDGVSFAPVPLKHWVKLPDGTHQQQLVPTAEYRFLRWSLGELSSGASKIVAARVRVIDDPALAAAP